jgi:hypothetical protein
VSDALDRLRKAWKAEVTEHIRYELRNGATIASAMESTGATKRQVEEQRAFLRQAEGLSDTRRNDTGSKVAQMEADEKTSAEIMLALKITRSTLHYHRRKNKKVS